MILALKSLHVIGLVIWCAGLIALPIMLRMHRGLGLGPQVVDRYIRYRMLTHITYTAVTTPAAVLAIAAGTLLIFAAGVHQPWLLLKLAFVALMVLAHAWCGHLVLLSGERELTWRMPPPWLALVVALPAMLAVLALVLAKPDLARLSAALPDWATAPLELSRPAWLQEVLP